MRSVREVIESLEEDLEDEMNCEYGARWMVNKFDLQDAIYYLSEFQRMQSQGVRGQESGFRKQDKGIRKQDAEGND